MEILRIEILQYVREVKMSDKRIKKYYELGKKDLPLKYQDKTKFAYKSFISSTSKKKRQLLVNLSTGEKVIANPKTFGTPKWKVINGQKIYNGEVSKWERNAVMGVIKDSYQSYIKKLNPIPISLFPINITMEIHDLVYDPLCKNQLWDCGNRAFPYMKGFEDALVGNKRKGIPTTKMIIPDDNILYIPSPPSARFIPVDKAEDRKLVFIISSETDPRILNHKEYKKFYNR